MGLSVVSQTLCKIDVLPAFALPIIRTRNLNFGSGTGARWVFIGATTVFGLVFGRARVVDRFDPVLDRLSHDHG
jgi:hypothetical protein